MNKCLIGESHASFWISEACAEISANGNDYHGGENIPLMGVEVVPLVSNDVDVFHRKLTSNATKCLEVKKSKIKKITV